MGKLRTFYSGTRLFKQEVVERFVLGLQEIYKTHPCYTFRENEFDSDILIYPTFADIQTPGKQPKIIAKVGGYQLALQDTLGMNLFERQMDPTTQLGRSTHLNNMVTNIMVLVQTYAEEQSANISDELAELFVFSANQYFANLGVIIQGVQVSETDVTKQEHNLFQTVLQLSVVVPWEFNRITDTSVVSPDFELDYETTEGYRQPGVEVYQKEINK